MGADPLSVAHQERVGAEKSPLDYLLMVHDADRLPERLIGDRSPGLELSRFNPGLKLFYSLPPCWLLQRIQRLLEELAQSDSPLIGQSIKPRNRFRRGLDIELLIAACSVPNSSPR